MAETTKKVRKSVEKPNETKSVAYSTRYGAYDGTVLDGQGITRNNSQYYKMYRVNTDIRRAIKEKQETSMKKGYEIHSTQKNGKVKVVEVPNFDFAMKQSGGINILKNHIVKNLDLFGYCYIVRTLNIKGAMKYEILDPRFCSVVTDTDLNPLKYIYKNPALKGKIQNFLADQIIVIMEDQDMDNPVF